MRRCKRSIADERLNEEAVMARVTGIGGVFFKSTSDHKRLAAWYRDNLGLALEIVKGPDSEENGKFAWIMDPDGNKVELWEPMIWDEKNKKT
jgi:hypothetical protein